MMTCTFSRTAAKVWHARPLSVLLLLMFFISIPAKTQESIPTLVPPTPMAVSDTGASDTLRSESLVAKIQRDGSVKVGVLYNEPPFGEFNIRGEVSGFDADLARLMAELWGVKIEIVQVTRQNAISMMQSGQVDMLLAALVHRRELDRSVEFSLSYRISKQGMMVKSDSSIETLFNLSNQSVGYVLGTPSEIALQEYTARTGLPVQAIPYYTLDQALTGLFSGEVQGIVGREEHLLRVASNYLDQIRILDEPVSAEPFAIAFSRQDINFRNLVNHTLQYLQQEYAASVLLNTESKLKTLYERYFPGKVPPADAITQWDNIGDTAPVPSAFGSDVPFPQQYIIPRLSAEKILRVAGVPETIPETAPDRDKRLATFHKSLIEKIVARWGVTVQYVQGDPMQLLQAGMVDLAVGIPLDWNYEGQVDFTQPYLMHGDRMLALKSDAITSINDLRGRWIATLTNDPGAKDRAQAWADSITANVNFFETGEEDALSKVFVDDNADVIYGDSLMLISYLEQDPNLELIADPVTGEDKWYSYEYMAFAVPRNDMDFRLLVTYTLQDLTLSGELKALLQPLMPPNSPPPSFDVWPGKNTLGGFLP